MNASGGGNYQTMINEALRQHIQEEQAYKLEEVVRRVVREELVNFTAKGGDAE